ncbi:hypothetical protein ZOSMA_146G00070 [Zostera marina]|uniref:Senescence regulator n=1 Tax=Zostera marina TaxID=29655 RepID=A0A0K9PZ64_ZOSMR|nr:hypothetical protein ZOSMA_146G00070 [Zostera marina]
MEAFRPKKSPLSDRLFGSFAASETLETAVRGNDGGELDEKEVFCVGTDFYSKSFPSDTENHSSASATMSPSGSFRLLPSVQSFGILAALPEDIKSQKKMPVRSNSFMQRKSSMSSMNTTSTSPSSSSARVMIPKPKSSEYNGGAIIFPQSAPMNVPVVSRESERNRNWWGEVDYEYVSDADDDEEDEGMLPPHEIVARASLRDSPMTTFSVLEGVGRTLKGSDLRRVRNAVWRQTGFLD